jgi:hypothetical protein
MNGTIIHLMCKLQWFVSLHKIMTPVCKYLQVIIIQYKSVVVAHQISASLNNIVSFTMV